MREKIKTPVVIINKRETSDSYAGEKGHLPPTGSTSWLTVTAFS